MKIQKNMILIVIIIFIILYIPTISNAALQANGGSAKIDNLANWMLNIRYMESTGGTLGLKDTINTTDLTSTATESNNLDIHMQLNTEYGILALFSASAYGNPNKINNGETTTGNKTGAYMHLNTEWTAAGAGIHRCNQYANANGKYKNVYTTSKSSSKVGDATVETDGWHGSMHSYWIDSTNISGLVRSSDGSIYSYYGIGNGESRYSYFERNYATRAVVVVGTGI